MRSFRLPLRRDRGPSHHAAGPATVAPFGRARGVARSCLASRWRTPIALALMAAAAWPLDHALSALVQVDTTSRTAWAIELVKPFGRGEIVLLLVLAAGALGWRRLATRAVIAMAVTGLVVGPLKLAVPRERPSHRAQSFPSGDVATIAAAAAPFARIAPAPMALAVSAIAGERLMLGKHWPTDVLAATAIAAASATAAARLARRRPSRRVFAIGSAAVLGSIAVAAVAHPRDDDALFLALWLPPAAAAVAVARWRRARRPQPGSVAGGSG